MSVKHLHLFQGFGIELEYMIVDQASLSILSIADEILHEVTGEYIGEASFAKTQWSNELVLHLIEIKTQGPAPDIASCLPVFQEDIQKINQILKKHSAKLLPTGMHPWMNPWQEAKLWPHDYNEVYEAYNRIFDCRGHGWANLQSTHLNLPFANDAEFAKLHTAIRLLMPILPALTASTPIVEGKLNQFLDNRIEFYRSNQQKIPSITGHLVPEVVLSKKEYEESILQKIYQDVSPYDPEKVLQYEWINSRGAIARFDRNTIEIRLLDVQEAPIMDLAILAFIVDILKNIIAEKWISFSEQMNLSEQELNEILLDTIISGLNTSIKNSKYLKAFGLETQHCTARELWQHILNQIGGTKEIQFILDRGNLAERIKKSLGAKVTLDDIKRIYEKLAQCLEEGSKFDV